MLDRSIARHAVASTLTIAALSGVAGAAPAGRPTGTIAFVSSYRADPYQDVVFEVEIPRRERRIQGRDVFVSPDGKLRATVARTPGGFSLSIGPHGTAGRRVAVWRNGRDGLVTLAWSPDSSRLVAIGTIGASSGYVSDDGEVSLYGPGEAWLARADGSQSRSLGRGTRATWSPDGTLLAIEQGKGIDLRRSDGTLIRTVPKASRVVWSHDGERTAYVRGRSKVVVADTSLRTLSVVPGPPREVFDLEWSPVGRSLLTTFSGVKRELITADGASRTRLFRTPMGWVGARPRAAPASLERLLALSTPNGHFSLFEPVLSRDARWVVLAGNAPGAGVYDAVSGRRLPRSPQVGRNELVRWSPDSSHLLVQRGKDLEAISVPGLVRRRIATLPADAELAWARWLGDGHIGYRVRRHTFPRLHLLDLQTLRSTEVGGVDVRTQPFYEDPWWSPDGSQLAARRTSNRGEDDSFVVVIGPGSGERRIGAAVGDRGRPTWSKDGAELALVTDQEKGVVSARRVAEGSDRVLARVPGALDVSWAPNSERIAVATDRGVIVVPLDRPGEQTYVAPRLSTAARRPPIASPTWSPDGSRIAYTGPQGLLVGAADGSATPTVLVRAAARPSAPTWSADGQWIVFAALDPACEDRLRLMIIPSAGGVASHLYRAPGCAGVKSPAWRP